MTWESLGSEAAAVAAGVVAGQRLLLGAVAGQRLPAAGHAAPHTSSYAWERRQASLCSGMSPLVACPASNGNHTLTS